MSSSVASIGEHTAQQNFNPSWMRSAFHGGGGGGVGATPRASANDEAQDDYPLSDPVLSDYRYAREDLLALAPKETNPPPGELAECPFFVEIAQPPIVANPLNDLEQRLQHNINSSKAMSSLSHAERASIAAGGVYGGGYSSAANGQSPNSPATRTPVGGGWTTQRQTSWTKNNTPERAQRGGASVRGSGGFYSRGGGRMENGGGTTNGNVSSTDEAYSKFAALRRGGGPGAVGRGGSTTAYNSRAEKLYSKDERPRGVGVSRSGSDEENDDGGWETVGAKNVQNGERTRPAWTRSESWTNRNNENSNTGGAWNRNEKTNGARDNTNVWKDRQQMLDSLQDAPDDNDVNTANPLTEPTSTTTDSSNSLQQTISDSVATTSDSYASQIQDAAALQQQQFSSAWSNQVMSGLPNMFDMERLRLAQMQQQQQQQQQIAAQLAAQQQAAALAQAQAAAVAVKKEPEDFYYLDPSETVRGPFSKDQMVAWFKAGYFSEESLRVKRENDTSYLTIGQLLQQNGKMTPFDYPDEKEPVRTSPTQALSQYNLTQQLNNPTAYGNFRPTNMWGTGPLDALVQSTLEKQLAAERQRIVDEYSRRAQEEADNFKKMQEAFMRQVSMHHEMTNQQYREQELVLQRQAEELQRREAEMKEHALELQKKLDEQHNQLNEKQRAINEEASRKAAEEQARKEREAQLAKKLAEEEERRKKAEQAAEMERQRLAREAEVAAERIRQLNIQKKVESDATARKKREEEDRRLAEELSRNQFEIEQSFEKATKPKQISPSGSDDSEGGWTSVAKPHTKPAPWAAAKPEPVKEKTLREIQIEEERQAKVEAERLANLRKEEQREQMSLQSAGTWGNASARLQWAGSVNGSASPPVKPKNAGPVWTTPQEPSRSSYVSPMFDGPSLEAANRIQPAKKVQAVAAKPAAPATAAPKKATVAPTPKPPVEQKSKEQQASEQMCTWFSKRFKQLSSNSDEVDTSMLFQFVMDLGNPNEVEDIVMSYLDESKSVKEFVREFLKRRIELRANNNKQSDHDDLSSARAVSAAPSDSNAGSMGGSGGSGVQGKKKKKNQRMVLDGNILGFRGAAASDRLNKGEIDAIPTAPVNPSRR